MQINLNKLSRFRFALPAEASRCVACRPSGTRVRSKPRPRYQLPGAMCMGVGLMRLKSERFEKSSEKSNSQRIRVRPHAGRSGAAPWWKSSRCQAVCKAGTTASVSAGSAAKDALATPEQLQGYGSNANRRTAPAAELLRYLFDRLFFNLEHYTSVQIKKNRSTHAFA